MLPSLIEFKTKSSPCEDLLSEQSKVVLTLELININAISRHKSKVQYVDVSLTLIHTDAKISNDKLLI